MSKRSHQPLADSVIGRVRSLVDELGAHETARLLNINHLTLARALAGLPLLASTRITIEVGLR